MVLEAAAIGLLGLLVAGLLRSHAEILRQLHHLGGGLELDRPAVGGEALTGGRVAQPVSLSPARSAGARTLTSLRGETPSGEVVGVALDREGERTLLLFLSSGCATCQPWWEGLRAGDHARALPGVRVAVVARDAAEESPSLLVGMAPPDVSVVLSSAAWEELSVPGSPYAVLVDGTTASVLGEGVARAWDQLGSLVGQHQADLAGRAAPAPPGRLVGQPSSGLGRRPGVDGPGREQRADGPGHERRADEELLAAGIHPGHPSLHPEPGSLPLGPQPRAAGGS